MIINRNKNQSKARKKIKLVLKMESEKEILAKIMVDNYRTKELISKSLSTKTRYEENGQKLNFETIVGTNEDFKGKKSNFI